MLEWLVSEPAQGVVRALLLAGILVVVGSTLFAARIAPLFAGDVARSPSVRARAGRTVRVASLLLLVVLLWRLVQQSAAFAESPAAWPSTVELVLTRTTWGTGWFVQAAGLALVFATSGLAWRRDEGAWLPLGAGALVLAASPSLAGHAIGAPKLVVLAVVGDTMHVLGAGAWLGTLFMIVVAALPAMASDRSGLTTAVLDRFSPIALGSAALVAVTGVFASWLHLETFSALWSTPYGRTLLLKVAILGGVAGVGAYNWRVVTPKVRATGDGAALRRSAIIEIVLAAILVGITAVLVATPLPAEM